MVNNDASCSEVRDMSADPPAVPPCALLVLCSECGSGIDVPLPIDREFLVRFLARSGWFVTIMTGPGHVPILFGALCGACAPRVFSPEILRAAEERRQKILAGEASVP